MNHLKKIHYLTLLVLASAVSGYAGSDSKRSSSPKNILFIAVDDLRTQANVYGQTQMKTPNLDRLGAEGVVFNRAYCNVPVCGASRASLMSGVRPRHDRFVTYSTRKDVDLPDVPSLGTWFKEQGYITLSNGKIYHHRDDDLNAWSEEPFDPPQPMVGGERAQYKTGESERRIAAYAAAHPGAQRIKTPITEAADVPDEGYPDGLITQKVLGDLRRLAQQDKPFFLAAGLRKPHLPFCAPKKYWDFYRPEDIKLADNPYTPENAPSQAMSRWSEMRGAYIDVPQTGPVSKEMERELVHGYYACVSYIDAQIGKLLDELDVLGLADDTVVILWGDHGWHLGEHTLWCKHSTFERTMNAPLMVRAPGIAKGVKTEAITEFIDIYPSLCDLAGIPKPKHLDGVSFVPVLKEPSTSMKTFAFSRYHDGEAVVSARYNYREWFNPDTGQVEARMLTDLEKDHAENRNVVDDEDYMDVVAEMSKRLADHRRELSK